MAKKKVLIIDDNADIVESAKIVLKTQGYDVDAASTKEEGFEKVKKINPDLIILDVMMEKMSDGFEIARKVKSDKKFQEVKILMITSVGEITGFHFSVVAGDKNWLPVDDYVEKPVSPENLVKKVKELIGGSED